MAPFYGTNFHDSSSPKLGFGFSCSWARSLFYYCLAPQKFRELAASSGSTVDSMRGPQLPGLKLVSYGHADRFFLFVIG